MKKLIVYIFILFNLTAGVFAVEIKFNGESPRNEKKIENGVNNLLRQEAKGEVVEDSVISWLYDYGYLDAVINIQGDLISITAGRRFVLDKVTIVGDSKVNYPTGGYFVQENIDRAIDAVLENYYDRGYYFARANITSVRREGNRVTLELELLKGPVVTVGKSLLLGLKRSRPAVVRRYLQAREGDTLTEETIRRAEAAAAAVPFINFRAPVSVRAEPGYNRADLEFNFAEKKQFAFIGGAGYVPDDPSGLVWNIDLTLRNLFGEGRRVRVYSERKEKGRNILDLTYAQPIFLLGLGEAEFEVATRDYRDQFYEFSLDAAYLTALKPGFETGLALGWKRVEPSTFEPAYSRFTAGFLLQRRAVDNEFNPSRGFDIDWTIEYVHRKYSEDSLTTLEKVSYNETRTEASANFYRTIFGGLVGHIGLNYYGLETGEDLPPLAELYFVGGPGTVRGFRNEQFTAQRTAFGTLEPRWRFRRGFLFAFYDAAYINRHISNNSGGIVTEELYRYGYGFGLALNDVERTLKLSLGWNRDMPLNQPRLSIELSSDI